MWKTILAGTAALMLVGSAISYAQQIESGRASAERWRPSADDLAAFGDARIAALHAGLKLNAEQEKNWPPVERALRDLLKQRVARVAARAKADRSTDPIERLAARAEAMEQRAAAMKKLAEAAAPLYKSLDDSQKHRFVALTAFARHRLGRTALHSGRHGWRHMEHYMERHRQSERSDHN